MPQTSEAPETPAGEATLLLTRPEAQSQEFLALCEALAGRRLPCVVSPVLEIVDLGEVPDLTLFRTVIVTSGNAVRRLGRTLAGRVVVTVGERTAALARDQGADARCLGPDVDAFLENIDGVEGPAVHVRGVHTRGDLAGRAAAKGLTVEEAVIYDQVARPLSRAAEALLQGNSPVVVPLFSPRSAGLLSATPIGAPIFVIAISPATRVAWTGPGRVTVAETPTAEAVCRAVTEAL